MTWTSAWQRALAAEFSSPDAVPDVVAMDPEDVARLDESEEIESGDSGLHEVLAVVTSDPDWEPGDPLYVPVDARNERPDRYGRLRPFECVNRFMFELLGESPQVYSGAFLCPDCLVTWGPQSTLVEMTEPCWVCGKRCPRWDTHLAETHRNRVVDSW